MLWEYHNEMDIPDDPFLDLGLEVDQTGLIGPLRLYNVTMVMELHMVKRKKN